MAEIVRKIVLYRKFRHVSGDWRAGTLEDLCVQALETVGANGLPLRDDWRSRQYQCWDSSDHFQFSYELTHADGSLFGMLCLYSPSEYIAMIKERAAELAEEEHVSLQDALKQVQVTESQPPAGESYLKGHLYFLIRGDHVFVVQHAALRASSLENYLHDLLRKTGATPADCAFILDSLLTLSVNAREMGDIKAVEVGGVTAAPPLEPLPLQSTVVDDHQQLGRARPTESKAKQILNVMFGTMQADQIMQAVPSEAELEVDVRFGFKTRKRRLNRAALSQIASSARDLPEGQVRAVGRDGKATGSDLRLQTDMPFHRLRPNGALLDATHAREQLLKVYARFVEDAKISP